MVLIHASRYEIGDITRLTQGKMINPGGIWYAPNDAWYQYAINKNIWKKYNYFYEIKLNYTTLDKPNKRKVLQIKNKRDFLNVTYKYGYLQQYPDDVDFIRIDWVKFARDFGGIEIIPYHENLRKIKTPELIKAFEKHGWGLSKKNVEHITWLHFFDVASGVVWDKSAIKSYKLIDIKKLKYFKDVK